MRYPRSAPILRGSSTGDPSAYVQSVPREENVGIQPFYATERHKTAQTQTV